MVNGKKKKKKCFPSKQRTSALCKISFYHKYSIFLALKVCVCSTSVNNEYTLYYEAHKHASLLPKRLTSFIRMAAFV